MRTYGCTCGALDCPGCHPESFVKDEDGNEHYIGDLDEMIPKDDSDYDQTDGAKQFQIETIEEVNDEPSGLF